MAHIRRGFCQCFLLGDDVEADGLIVGKLVPTGSALLL
ncbi:hypothetical protein C4K25_0586 [Pseudomonas chlororaphis]|nr:hypothetical protein C4K25_0586 [Pseudomonas chlororaphis]